MENKIEVYKGTDKDMKCRGHQFELGKTYTEESASLCKKGWHGCENPFDVLKYYPPAEESRYFLAKLDATEETHSDDTKRVGKSISLKAEIGLTGLVKAGIDFVFKKIDWKNTDSSNSGDCGTAVNSGDWGTAANSGDCGTVETTVKDTVAVASGYGCSARGVKGSVLFLIERNDDYEIISHKSLKVDGKRYKENILYKLRDGKVVEA